MRVHALPILATMVIGVMLLSGVVLAKTMTCHNKCEATNGSDYYVGDDSKNTIYGLAGDDYVGGLGAADMLLGGRDNDKVQGGSGKDRLEGGRGVDKVVGKPGYDILLDQPEKGSFAQLSSQRGAYQVQGGRPDRLLGGEGNDTIRARDGKKDIIRGGPGYDKAYVDKVDKVKGVEKEVVPGGGGGPGGGNPQCKDGKATTATARPTCKIEVALRQPTTPRTPNQIVDPQKKQCEDGKDNDGDGKIDFGTGANNDPGCDSLTDDTENTPPKNTPPVAKGDSYSVYEDTHLNVVDGANDILSNDTDADNPNNTNAGLTVKDADSTTQGVQPESGPAQGLLTLNADGSSRLRTHRALLPTAALPT